MSPPVVATYKVHVVGKEQIKCEPVGGGGRFSARTTLSWESQDNGQYLLEFFVWDGIKETTQPDWPFVDPAPIAPNKAITPTPDGKPFQGVLKATESGEGVYAYSVSREGFQTLDPIIVVDN